MDKSINVDNVVSLMGAYHRQQYPTIVSKFRSALLLKDIFPILTMVRDELVVTEALAGEIMQPYQSSWTPKGSVSFSPEILKVRYAKADISIDPNVFRATHLAEFLKTATSEEHELVRLAYNKYLEGAAKDTTKALIVGQYKTPEAGTAGKAVDTCDGFIEFIKKAIASTKITPTVTGKISAENIIDKVEAIYMDIPEDMRDADLRCYMSSAMRRMYFLAYRDRFGINTDYKGWDGCVDGTDIPIIGLPNMGDSQLVVFSPHGNFRTLALNESDQFKFETQKDKRNINFLMDWSLGFGAMIVGKIGGGKADQYIWCNETDSSENVAGNPTETTESTETTETTEITE